MPDFDVKILVACVKLDAEESSPGDLENGDSEGIGKFANGLERGLSIGWVLFNENVFFSGLPGVGWLGVSRMLLKTLEVADSTLLPLRERILLLWLAAIASSSVG